MHHQIAMRTPVVGCTQRASQPRCGLDSELNSLAQQARPRSLPSPDLTPLLSCEIPHARTAADASVSLISVYNAVSDGVRVHQTDIARVVASSKGRSIWQAQLRSRATALAASSGTALVGCLDGKIYLLDAYCGALGRAPLLLGGAICHLACAYLSECEERLAAIADDGQLHMWNLTSMQCWGAVSVNPLLKCAVRGWNHQEVLPIISELRINQLGLPVIKLSTHGARRHEVAVYTLNSSTWCWSQVDPSLTAPSQNVHGDAARRASDTSPNPVSLESLTSQLLHVQLRNTSNKISPMSLTSMVICQNDACHSQHQKGDDLSISLQQLEECLIASKLDAASERAHWLRLYCRRLKADNDRRRLRALIVRLTGTSSLADTMLLRSVVLPELSQDSAFEPLCTELSEFLKK
mmetsp:Transcript_8529/g.26639  ORF Transcript_8529/g.26639 Transcript_8529/m.26639 type:complete len:409 (-) Transcript_8529:798-2024(-)